MDVVASLSQGRTAAAHCGLFTHKSVPVIFEPPCSCNCWLFHRIYYDARNNKHKINLQIILFVKFVFPRTNFEYFR